MSREAHVQGDVLVQKKKFTKFSFEALKCEQYTNVKTSFCLSVTHIGQKARFLKNESRINEILLEPIYEGYQPWEKHKSLGLKL